MPELNGKSMIWLTNRSHIRTMRALMSNGFPDSVDVWRMVNASRSYEGTLAVASLTRLSSSLAEARGKLEVEIEFGRDALTVPFLHLKVRGQMPLTCQRSLEVFDWPLAIDTRLGLIRREEDEAALPPGFEPLLVHGDGEMILADVIEDEVILALPLVPRKPDLAGTDEWTWSSDAERAPVQAESKPNPFAALAQLKPKPKQ